MNKEPTEECPECGHDMRIAGWVVETSETEWQCTHCTHYEFRPSSERTTDKYGRSCSA